MLRIKAARSPESPEPRSLGNRIPYHANVGSGAVLLATILSLFMAVAATAGGPIPDPDKHAWELLATMLAQPANNGSNDAVFETWATDQDTFPPEPAPGDCASPCACTVPPDPCEMFCPCWPGLDHRPDKHVPISQNPQGGGDATEIVYRNRATFDYIVDNDLWYTEGVEEALFGPNPIVIEFPVLPEPSIEVKGNYVANDMGQCDANCASNGLYHCSLDNEGVCRALVSFHVITKELPNWFWATFEHKDNLGQCDYMGCHDTFGAIPADVPPKLGCDQSTNACTSDCQADNTPCAPSCLPCGQQYNSELTPEAMALLQVNLPTAGVWENYRLKGTQVDFVDADGEPLLLGNSVTEDGFVATSSCITCHSRAAVSNQSPPKILQIFECACSEKNCQAFDSYNGTPQLDWFDPGGGVEFKQTDFVWAIGFKARSMVPPSYPNYESDPSFANLPQCLAATGACCDGATAICEDAVTQSECACATCEWTVDAICDDVTCVGPRRPQACIFGQMGIFAIPMMLVALSWMRLSRHRRRVRGRS